MNSLRGPVTNRKLTQCFVRRLQSLKLRSTSTATNVSSSADAGTEIQIPFRKERSATDILMALEKTISRDYTAPHYKYHDDPYLIPLSNRAKRTYALSKESGRKAAMWIHKEHADLFMQKLSDPEIKAFMPKVTYNKKEEVSEELLLNTIKDGLVTDALTIYNLLEKEVSVECKQALLELLCFHNNEEPLNEELTEERWYRNAANRQMQPWRGGPEIEELFGFLKKQDTPVAAAAYNALICGTAKYLKAERAWSLYEECEAKNIPLCLNTYNYLIQLVFVLRDGTPERKALMFDLFEKIDKAGLRPNLGTLNAALRVTSMISASNVAKDLTRSIFTEFKKLGIEPSLASYYFAIHTFCKDRGPRSIILREILDEIEGKTFTMQDRNDTSFFVIAMSVAKNHLEDRSVGEKIHKLLMTGNNYNLIGEGFKESIYYRHYTTLLLKTLLFHEFMEFYNIMVPNVYIPEPSVMEEILDLLKPLARGYIRESLPRLWSDMVMFEQLDREILVAKTFDLMRSTSESSEKSVINDQYAESAWTYWNFVKDQSPQKVRKISWSGKILADIAILSERGDKFDRFLDVIGLMVKEQNTIIGTASSEQLSLMFEACLERGHAPGALDVLAYSVEAGFPESHEMSRKIQGTIPLTNEQQMQIVRITGTESLQKKMPINEDSAKSEIGPESVSN